MLNFFSNAVKYSKHGGIIEFRIKEDILDDKYSNLTFEVQDSGSIDSLIVSLMNASHDISVQAVVAVSDKIQIHKIL